MHKRVGSKAADILLAALMVCLAVLAYSGSLKNPFTFDDIPAIERNPAVLGTKPLPLYSRSLVDLSFRMNFILGGLNPADFRATNLLIHIAGGLLLFGIIRRTLRLPGIAPRYGGAELWLSGFVAALWMVHPLQTESVTYICQRYESLAGMFYLLCLYSFVRALSSPMPRLWYDLCIGACLLGMACKEVMVTAPVLVFLYDYVFVSGSVREALRARGKVYLALLGAWIVFLLLWLHLAVASAVEQVPMVSAVPPLTYLLTQFGVIAHYARLAVVPWPLCLDYAWPPAQSAADIVPHALILAPLAAASVWALWRRAPAGFLAASFFLLLAPTSSVIPVPDIAVEHRMYLASAPLLALIAGGAWRLFARVRRGVNAGLRLRIFAAVAGAAVLAGFAFLTALRNTDYASAAGMWADIASKRPANLRAWRNLAAEHLLAGRHREAARCAAVALRLTSEFTSMSRQEIWRTSHLSGDPGVRQKPMHYAATHNTLGTVAAHEGRNGEALTHYGEACRVAPHFAAPYGNMAEILRRQGRTDEAIELWKTVLRLAPDDAGALVEIAAILEESDRIADAKSSLEAALRRKPGSLVAKSRLAWILATANDPALRDGSRALRMAEEAASATGHGSVRALDILAAACAEAGDFDRAVRTATLALERARTAEGAGQESVVTPEELAARLKLYESHQPLRVGGETGL